MATRRGFLSGMLAAGVAPRLTWADVGAPDFLSAAQAADGQNYLIGLTRGGDPLFRLPLPARGHAACAHPALAEAAGFARRPGVFAFIISCFNGQMITRLAAPKGRHFYGHGTYSRDGAWLFTTENDYDNGLGVIGVWDVLAGYARAGEFASGGIGPHEIRLVGDVNGLVVANGGIETHPDSGRTKLNLADMRPNLCYLDLNGKIVEKVEAGKTWRMNSIRHLDIRADGLVAVALQWQGDRAAKAPVVALHRRGGALQFLTGPQGTTRHMAGYGGSVVFSGDGKSLAVSSPRGGIVQVFDSARCSLEREWRIDDVCGLGADGDGFVASTGGGEMHALTRKTQRLQTSQGLRWDNHLIPVGYNQSG